MSYITPALTLTLPCAYTRPPLQRVLYCTSQAPSGVFYIGGLNAFQPGQPTLTKPLDFQPTGLNAFQSGRLTLTKLLDFQPTGLNAFQSGQLTLTKPLDFQPTGLNSFQPGQFALLKSLDFQPTGLDSFQPGQLQFYYTQFISLRSSAPSALGTPDVSNQFRWMYPQSAPNPPAPPAPRVSYYTQVINFDSVRLASPGFPKFGQSQTIVFNPAYPAAFGHFFIGARPVPVDGSLQTQFGNLRTYLATQLFSIRTPDTTAQYGEPYLFNLRQYFNHYNDLTDLDAQQGEVFGRFRVDLYDRPITPAGHYSLRTGIAPIDLQNAARPLLFVGFDSFVSSVWPEQHLIAYRVRPIRPQGADALLFTNKHLIGNAARQLIFAPIAPSNQFGDVVTALWRYINFFSQSHTEFGALWVSRSPRAFQLFGYPSLESQTVWVSHVIRQIFPNAIDSFKTYPPTLTIRPPIKFSPRWLPIDYWDAKLFGYPTVRNVTPQLFMRGRDSFDTLFRGFMVSYLNRPIYPQSSSSLNVPRIILKDKKQTVYMEGTNFNQVTQKLIIYNVSPDPPTLQFILPVGFCTTCPPTLPLTIGAPSLREPVFTPDGVSATQFGNTLVTSNVILFLPKHYLWSWSPGEPTLFGGRREITPASIKPNGVPAIRTSPHTIYFRPDVPQQARKNHPNRGFHPVDSFTPYGREYDVGPWFGRFSLLTPFLQRISFVNHTHDSLIVSNPTVELENRTVFFDGLLSFKQGYPELSNGASQLFSIDYFPNAVEPVDFDTLEDYQTDSESVVAATHSVYGVFSLKLRTKYFTPIQKSEDKLGKPDIQLFNRSVLLKGIKSDVYGNNNPLVHFPRRISPNADLSLFGDLFIDFRIRYRELIGQDSAEYGFFDVESSKQQIEVYRHNDFTEFGDFRLNTPYIQRFSVYSCWLCPPSRVEVTT